MRSSCLPSATQLSAAHPHVVMTDDEQRVIRKTVGNLIGLAIVAYVGKVNLLGGIPTHGILLALTVFEWVLLAWVFATPFFLARPGTPLRWWLYFGAICSIILLPILREYILYQAGRRPWMPDPHWWVKGGILTTCLILGPWTVACWKRRRGKVETHMTTSA